ncbi:MAG: Mth938-like domain-containing protein [Alphaproteobacteria bacterium]|jgi:uncharacterized protein|nr:hypothetical protein [Rhodospirillaceae bacterium]MBT6509208.1 hypothetical protein [Rhodospirillaceae bacterium]MBT7613627.1 hypothetical protein [Rhodospirillaceae bacterium]MBT7649160.1 hypothetical protein [Rhodospirillaceae bacterium]MDG2481327.1 Mth938-like domain-containing protein [Alphaproteobacteria bacterium]
MSEEAARPRKVVTAYGDGGFRIAGDRVEGSVIVFPEFFLPWPVAIKSQIRPDSFAEVIEHANKVDILLLGCGKEPPLVSEEIRNALRPHGVIIDAMDTGAACRTFNILLAEGRAVAAALIAI